MLADLAGLSGPYISLIENGVRTPSFETVEQFAKALKVDVGELLK
jgi:transcriptional regulator with XRE-family HTH domain